jgi:hypothetical protein
VQCRLRNSEALGWCSETLTLFLAVAGTDAAATSWNKNSLHLECGRLKHGFARARCDGCGHDYFVAFSCKGRGLIESVDAKDTCWPTSTAASRWMPVCA